MSARSLALALTGSNATATGALLYAATNARRRGDDKTARALTSALDELRARDARRGPGPGTHPQSAARPRPPRERGGLTPSDMAWLATIAGRAPATIPFEDATAVAEILASLSSDERSDRRYVESIWKPIDEHHTRRIAEGRLAQIKQTSSAMPAAALDLIAKELATELGGDFTEDEIRTRAKNLADEVSASYGAQLYAQAHAAQEQLGQLDTAQAERAQVNR